MIPPARQRRDRVVPSSVQRRVRVKGNGPPLLLVHGGTGPDIWGTALDYLIPHFEVYLPTLPGFLPEDGLVRYSDRACVDFLEQVRKEFGLARWSVAGVSIGGRIALSYAAAHEEFLDRLVVIDSTGLHSPLGPLSWPVLTRLTVPFLDLIASKSTLRSLTLTRDVADRKGPAAAYLASFINDILKDSVVRRNVADAIVRGTRPKRDWALKLPRLTIPSLVLWGADDPTAPVRGAYRLASYLAASQLEIIRGCRHSGVIERPQPFAEAMITFLTAGPVARVFH